MNRPFNVHLLIDTRINPEAYGIPEPAKSTQDFKKRLYKLHQTDEFSYGWNYPNEPDMMLDFSGDRTMNKAEYKRRIHNYREYERERNIDQALSYGVKR